MNDMGMSKHDQVLMGLVFTLQMAAMQHLGKMKNPVTDEIERNLEQARGTIDILEMLKAKCRQDTPDELLKMLDSAVMDLQMNYLEESKRDASEETPEETSGETTEETPPEDAADETPADE